MKILRNSILCVWATGIGLADSGWTSQNPQPTGSVLRAVVALNANTTIAVGDQGAILRTTDAGATWTRISSGTAAMLSGVSFADANSGMAVGDQGADSADDGWGLHVDASAQRHDEHALGRLIYLCRRGTVVGGAAQSCGPRTGAAPGPVSRAARPTGSTASPSSAPIPEPLWERTARFCGL